MKIKPLAEITTYNFEENNQYDETTIDLVRKFNHLPYNAQIVEEIENIFKRNGFSITEEQKRALGTRVYFGRGYIRNEQKTNAGYQKLEIDNFQNLDKHIGQKIEFEKEGILGKSTVQFTIKKVGEKIIFQKPRQRTRYYPTTQFLGDYFKII